METNDKTTERNQQRIEKDEGTSKCECEIRIQVSLMHKILEAEKSEANIDSRIKNIRYVADSASEKAELIRGLLPSFRRLAAEETNPSEIQNFATQCLKHLEKKWKRSISKRAVQEKVQPTGLVEEGVSWFLFNLNNSVHKISQAFEAGVSLERRKFAIRELFEIAPNLMPMLRDMLCRFAAREGNLPEETARLKECIRLLDDQLGRLQHWISLGDTLPIVRDYKMELVAQLAKARNLSLRAQNPQPGLEPWLTPLFEMPDILGIGYGAKLVKGIPSGNRPALRVYVPLKKPERELRKNQLIPRQVNGIPTDVIELGKISVCPGTLPLKCGFGVGAAGGGVGTAACLVERIGEPGRRYLLSCAHVLATNLPSPQKGDLIYYYSTNPAQPKKAELIARLDEWTTPGAIDQVDAAIAELIHPETVSAEILRLGRIINPPIDAGFDQFVVKHGYGTGDTMGVVQDLSATVKVKFTTPTTDTILFHDELGIHGENIPNQSSFSLPGDSGSMVVDATRRNPVGLIFSEGEKKVINEGEKKIIQITFAHKIVSVLNRLGVKILA